MTSPKKIKLSLPEGLTLPEGRELPEIEVQTATLKRTYIKPDGTTDEITELIELPVIKEE